MTLSFDPSDLVWVTLLTITSVLVAQATIAFYADFIHYILRWCLRTMALAVVPLVWIWRYRTQGITVDSVMVVHLCVVGVTILVLLAWNKVAHWRDIHDPRMQQGREIVERLDRVHRQYSTSHPRGKEHR